MAQACLYVLILLDKPTDTVPKTQARVCCSRCPMHVILSKPTGRFWNPQARTCLSVNQQYGSALPNVLQGEKIQRHGPGAQAVGQHKIAI